MYYVPLLSASFRRFSRFSLVLIFFINFPGIVGSEYFFIVSWEYKIYPGVSSLVQSFVVW